MNWQSKRLEGKKQTNKYVSEYILESRWWLTDRSTDRQQARQAARWPIKGEGGVGKAYLSWKKLAKVSRWTMSTGCSTHSSHVTSSPLSPPWPWPPSDGILSWSCLESVSLILYPMLIEGTVITAPVVQSAFHPGIEAVTQRAGSRSQSALTKPKGNLLIGKYFNKHYRIYVLNINVPQSWSLGR